MEILQLQAGYRLKLFLSFLFAKSLSNLGEWHI